MTRTIAGLVWTVQSPAIYRLHGYEKTLRVQFDGAFWWIVANNKCAAFGSLAGACGFAAKYLLEEDRNGCTNT